MSAERSQELSDIRIVRGKSVFVDSPTIGKRLMFESVIEYSSLRYLARSYVEHHRAVRFRRNINTNRVCSYDSFFTSRRSHERCGVAYVHRDHVVLTDHAVPIETCSEMAVIGQKHHCHSVLLGFFTDVFCCFICRQHTQAVIRVDYSR